MNELPRQKLNELIVQYGRSLSEDPRRCEALLRDFCGKYRGEIAALINAQKEGVVSELLKSSNSVPREILLARLTKRLQDDLYMTQEAARWAVEAWAEAMGVTVSGGETASNPQEKPAKPSNSEMVASLKVDALKAEIAVYWNAAKQMMTRRRWLSFAVWGGVGLIATILIRKIFEQVFPSKPTTDSPGSHPKPLIVSSLGQGDYETISEAIKNAKSGTSILVQPGVYRESFAIDKFLKIIGDGAREEIIIESRAGSCIFMQTDEAVVRGLTLHGNVVSFNQGKLVLEACDIDITDVGSCVSIHGSTARAVIGQCRIRNGNIYVNDSGEVTVENCDIHHGSILIANSGEGTIENCEISDSGGVFISSGGNAVIRQCQIHGGKGILVSDSGKGTIEDCDIFDNEAGVAIFNEGNAVIRQCQIHDGKWGFSVSNRGEGTVENCDIFGNAYAGVSISSEGNPIIRSSRINRNNLAVYVSRNGKGTIEDCDLTNNNHGAWSIDSTSSVQRSRNIE